jgi:hypothetical protein
MAEDSHVQIWQDLAFCEYQFQRHPVQTMTDPVFENALADFVVEGGGSVTLTPIAGGIGEWRPPPRVASPVPSRQVRTRAAFVHRGRV